MTSAKYLSACYGQRMINELITDRINSLAVTTNIFLRRLPLKPSNSSAGATDVCFHFLDLLLAAGLMAAA